MLIYLNNGFKILKKKNKVNFIFFSNSKNSSKKIKLLNKLTNELINKINLEIINKNEILIKKLLINLLDSSKLNLIKFNDINLKNEIKNLFYYLNGLNESLFSYSYNNLIKNDIFCIKNKLTKEKNLIILLYLLIYLYRINKKINGLYLVKTKKKLMTLLKGPHIDKKGREQFIQKKIKSGLYYPNYLENKWTTMSIMRLLTHIEGILVEEYLLT